MGKISGVLCKQLLGKPKTVIQQLISYIKEQDAKFIFLALMLIVLPSFEALKNLFVVLFLVSWVFISKRDKKWGGKWRLIDAIFLLWVLADIAAGVNAVIVHGQPASGSRDIIKFVLVGWVISRSGFSTVQMIHLSVTAIIFAIIPLAYSYLNCNGGGCVELNSVGHVNHTAIYLLSIYTISLSLFVFNFKNIGNFLRIVLALASIILFYVVIDTHSRAASGLISVITLMAMLYSIYYYRSWRLLIISLSLISLTFIALVYNPPAVMGKFINSSGPFEDSSRQKIRNFSYYVFRIDPILGVGMGNFPNFSHNDIKDDVIKNEGGYDKGKFIPYAHPHNLYYAYLTGGGVILFSIFSWFWLQIVNIIYRVSKKSNEEWIVFSGISVTMLVLGIGWVNTTLAHEHALIAMFVLGLLISRDRALSDYTVLKFIYKK
jgi:hypothetical protein